MNQRTFRQPEYLYRFTPCMKNLLTINESYRIGILEWGNQHQKDQAALKATLDELNQRSQHGNVTAVEYQQYDREVENLNLAKVGKQRLATTLISEIEFELPTLYGMFNDIMDDVAGDHLSPVNLNEFLSGYQAVIQALTDNNLYSYYPAPVAITEAIAKHLTQPVAS